MTTTPHDKALEAACLMFNKRLAAGDLYGITRDIVATYLSSIGGIVCAREPVGWAHRLNLELDQFITEFTGEPEHPFGKPGEDYSSAYTVTSTPLHIPIEAGNCGDWVFASRHNDKTGECEPVDVEPAMVRRLREKIEAKQDDGWLDIASAPKDSPIIAISWQDGYGSFESKWSKPEVYEWDEMHSYWANKQRGTCIWPKYQDRYRCKSLGRSPLSTILL